MSARSTPPPIRPVGKLQLPDCQQFKLDNGIPVAALNLGTQPIVKLDVIFRAGRAEEQKRLASRAAARLLRDGTTARTGAEIAEQLDFWGASLNSSSGMDLSGSTFYCLKKYADRALPILADVLQNPVFPEKELDVFINSSVQELAVELAKPETVAYREISELIFGQEHPYGWNSVEATYRDLKRADLASFFEKFYTPDNALVVVAGRVDDELISLINKELGQKKAAGQRVDFNWRPVAEPPRRVDIEMPGGSLQTAVKIGRHLFPKSHPDQHGFSVLNTILGGYFGSRLMTNIREKKGLTYNIYSTVDAMLRDGYFYIATEVNNEQAERAISEIFKEMDKLRTRLVPDTELEMVRNYLLGTILNGLDGAINTSELVKSMLADGQPFSEFDRLVETVKNISARELRELARQYLIPEAMWTVVVK